ncbi:hypothetical protein H5410_043280 [Solanum commersonii]|uniref:Uncharacterized protein n=1 Tax=Solanum commersonii TaxID=4109 RepID=A0A9J5Y0Y9_SOLCO|nr:hypothetical protein H5410_043280 [Solanum commersonii]
MENMEEQSTVARFAVHAIRLLISWIEPRVYQKQPLYIAKESHKQWKSMVRIFGAAWAISDPPKDAVKFRFQVKGSAGVPLKLIPSDWKAGILIDTHLHTLLQHKIVILYPYNHKSKIKVDLTI